MVVTSHVNNLHHLYFPRILHVQQRITCKKGPFPPTHSFRYMATIDITKEHFSATGAGTRCHVYGWCTNMWPFWPCHTRAARAVIYWPWTSTNSLPIPRAINWRSWPLCDLEMSLLTLLNASIIPSMRRFHWSILKVRVPARYNSFDLPAFQVCVVSSSPPVVTFNPRGHKQCQG